MNENIEWFENLSERQIKWMRRVLFILIILSCFFVVNAAWTDLNHPGSLDARKYQSYATYCILAMILLAVPLWHIKLRNIKIWKEQLNEINDPSIKNKLVWSSLRSIIYQIIFIIVSVIIMYYLINTYFKIPDEIIANYTNYYNRTKIILTP